MPLSPGTHLGPYEILEPLGAGGMGEVYKAKDTRLDRLVAVKVLPTHLSDRPELRQRFEREARAISSLQHPHICTLFDVGHQAGTDYLVMEHLEGETLADRLARGPLPPEQVLAYGIEIAGALEKAHRQGLVHRDLKPGNVMLTRTGVKLLDFGLAKMAAGQSVGGAADALTSLPTEALGSQPLTVEGTLLGTFQYMAPEQLEGNEADARTDLFAFGALLYEMATARVAFQGKSRASLISAIMSADPPSISSLQPLTSPALDRVVRTCLAKDPDDRWQTAHDVSLQLRWIAEGGSQAGLPAPVAARRRGRERVAWIVAAAGVLVAAGLGAVLALRRPEPVVEMRFTIPVARAISNLDSPRISPDGRFIAVNATDTTGANRIWLRPLGSLEFQGIPGTDGATRPFWSPDSRFIAFIAGGKLKKVPVTGGPAQTICDAPTGSDGSWGSAGVILFDGRGTDPLRRVSAAGGVAAVAVTSDSGVAAWPHFLPDGKHFLYNQSGAAGPSPIVVGTLGSKKTKSLGIEGSRVEYSPAGYLLYVRDRVLLAQPFDARSLKVRGEPIPVAEPIGVAQGGALAHFSVSTNGVLIYSAGGSANHRLLWHDRKGNAVGAVGTPGDIQSHTISPDQRRVVARISDPQTGNRDIWIMELGRGTSSRLTFGAANDNTPVWSRDGSRIYFNSNRRGVFDLYQKLSNGTGEEESLLVTKNAKYLSDISADGRTLAYHEEGETKLDLWVLPLDGDRKPRLFLKTPFDESAARFSPDGRWVAYDSDESGRREVYVQAFPGGGGKWQVSTVGGSEPTWRGDAKELFYLAPDNRLMSVAIQGGGTFEAAVPAPLFVMTTTPDGWYRYAPSADGQRFLIISPERSQMQAPTTVVLHWNAGIGRK